MVDDKEDHISLLKKSLYEVKQPHDIDKQGLTHL
jgi:hypothetical protein